MNSSGSAVARTLILAHPIIIKPRKILLQKLIELCCILMGSPLGKGGG